ncbi:MAG: DEAD/DEAH box helicase [Candidatus Magnetomorum sp.]|nr:DEAD/DEAH box helicase [Candidatus Magnetomorum sp.]
MNKLLHTYLSPERNIQFEWEDTRETVSKPTQNLQDELFSSYSTHQDDWLLRLGLCDPDTFLSPSLDYLRQLAQTFTQKLQKTSDLEILRETVEISLSEEEQSILLDRVPMMPGAEYINDDFIEQFLARLHHFFVTAITHYEGSVESFIQSFRADVHLIGRIYFHLVENKQGDEPFAFLVTYSTQLNTQGKSRHLPLKYALQEYGDDQEKLMDLLSTVYRAAENSRLVNEMVETGELFHPLAWSPKEAYTFLKEIPLYEASGILCRIPNWWKVKGTSSRLNINLGDRQPSLLGMDAILSFNASIFIGGLELSPSEAKKLLLESEGLAFIKNKWIPVDHEKLKQTLAAYESAEQLMKEGLTIRQAMQLQLTPQKMIGIDIEDDDSISISNGEWFDSVMQKLRNPDQAERVKLKRNFKADLRAYQTKGVNWLYYLHNLNFGACLADDMGLGKTVQLLAFLNAIIKKDIKNANLLILPASLIANWINEIHQFYPQLKYFVAHPGFHPPKFNIQRTSDQLDSFDLVITTYALSYRYEWIQSYFWRYIILDEAQAIKNAGTKQSKGIKNLNSNNRIVMTGTPIENRLGDLWSLFDFLNPGLLGNKNEFADFAKNLKNKPGGYKRLRRIIRPYILRRLKTDKSIISDLPDKVEMKTFADLSKKQIVLYQKIISEMKQVIENSEGIQRKGLILSALIKFKQLCNHPDQYLGTDTYDEKHSGKFLRLREICETIYEKRERVLVFTQFKEITTPLADFLATIFNREGSIIHGSIPVKKRKERIDHFQSDAYVPFMILSLKAGGVGLNLTRANHVIHFDRWWNPAVENQATDRAFRIGQKKNVMVHKFITRGSIEEKIDQMLEEKKQLSNDIIESAGEAWITEMSNNDIVKLFQLTL